MKNWAVLAISAALFALWKGGQIMSSDSQVQRIAEAIARAEGFGVLGAIPTLRNNPGNIRSQGGIGPVATYDSVEEGWQHLYSQVRAMLNPTSSIYGPEKTIRETARIYTGEAMYMNWATNVASILGVSVETPLGNV